MESSADQIKVMKMIGQGSLEKIERKRWAHFSCVFCGIWYGILLSLLIEEPNDGPLGFTYFIVTPIMSGIIGWITRNKFLPFFLVFSGSITFLVIFFMKYMGGPVPDHIKLDEFLTMIFFFSILFSFAGSFFAWAAQEDQRESKKAFSVSKRKQLFQYDIFICHASEDKEPFVRELAEKLSNKGVRVWYDEFTLSLGDNLRRKIEDGLAGSRYGVVILSKNFFKKEWPQKELDGLIAREDDSNKVILPVWHRITKEEVRSFSPTLAGRFAVLSDRGVDYIVDEILRVLKSLKTGSSKKF